MKKQTTTTNSLPVKVPAAMSGAELVEAFKGIQWTKSTAVQLLALNSAIKGAVDAAKEYLLNRCADTGSYEDPVTGLTMTVRGSTLKTATSTKIIELEAELKKEKELVLKGVAPGNITETTVKSWSLKK